MRDLLTSFLMLFGASFMLLASIGMLRLPDIFLRMHASTKSGTLGVMGFLAAVAIHFADFTIAIQALLTILFVCLTAPVAAHVMGRSAYWVGVPMWKKSVIDELEGHYKERRGEVSITSAEEETLKEQERVFQNKKEEKE